MKRIKKAIGIVLAIAIALVLLPFILLGYYTIPKFRRMVNKKYMRAIHETKKEIKRFVMYNGKFDSVINGIPVYVVPASDLDKQTGGAFHATGLGIVISQSLINHPCFTGILQHELGHAVLRHKYGRSLFRLIKNELEADKYAVEQGYGKKIKEYLIQNFKKDPKKNLVPYLLIHFWRILALKLQGV